MNLANSIVQVATAPVRVGLAVADLGLNIAGGTLKVVQRSLNDTSPSGGTTGFAAMLGIDDAVDRANRLARLMDDDAPLGRALAPEGPLNQLLRPGGLVDQLIMGLVDVLLSFPTLLLGLMVAAMLGASLENLIIAIAITEIAPFVRVARAPTIALKQRDFVEAGRALGYGPLRLMGVHILPNMVSDVVVLGSLWMASAIRTEASLSFIGLGVPPPAATWGSMIREGFENILDAWWLTVFPSVAILLTVLALNLLGDALRDAIDPKLRSERS